MTATPPLPTAEPSARDLLASLAAAGAHVSLTFDNDLRIRGTIPDDLIEHCRSAKPALVDALLHGSSQPGDDHQVATSIDKPTVPVPGRQRCDRCGSEQFTDVPIHGGRSTRRDCSKCSRTAGFPKWDPASD